MITAKLQFILIIVLVCYFIVLFHFLANKQLLLKYSLTWILVGVILIAFAISPRLLKNLANLFGIYLDINFLFLMMLGLSICITMSLTVIVSRMSYRNKELIQATALLEKRLRIMEEKVSRLEESQQGECGE